MRGKDSLERCGQDEAARHLTDAGLVVLDRNWRSAEGELDIVAAEASTLVFCHVRTRSSVGADAAAAEVSAVDADRIRRLALRWLIADGGDCSADCTGLHFDVVRVGCRGSQTALVEHFPDAF